MKCPGSELSARLLTNKNVKRSFVYNTYTSHRVRGERFGPADQRDLTMLSYLGRCFESRDSVPTASPLALGAPAPGPGPAHAHVPPVDLPPPTRSLNALVPYRVSWSSLALHVMHTEPAFEPVPREQYLRVFNASLVALCSAPESQV